MKRDKDVYLKEGDIINKDTDEILHRGRWQPAKEFGFTSDIYSRENMKKMRRAKGGDK